MAVDTIARGIASGRVPITAYDMAVAGGYTGTKEQFEADMGNSGTNATNAANSAAAAAASAAEASAISDDIAQYKTDTMTAPANITAGEYVLAAGTLYVATANIASGSTLTPNGNVKQVTVGGELTDVIASNANKADANGVSPNLTSGNALQLVSTVGIEDQVPYNFRTSGGSADIGDRETDKIVGGTVAWNQLCTNGNFTTASGWNRNRCTLTVADNIGTFSCNDVTYKTFSAYKHIQVLKDHVYMMTAQLQCDTTNAATILQISANEQIRAAQVNNPENGVWYSFGIMVKPAADIGNNFQLVIDYANVSDVTIGDKILAKNVNIFDLTQMFGGTIANYIYSLEQNNKGDGVAWFRKLFPLDFYAADSGTLRSVNVSSHDMVGFNAWDEAWESGNIASATGTNTSDSNRIRSKNYIRVVPGASYYLKSPTNANLFKYDGSQNYLGYQAADNRITTLGDDVCYIRFSVGSSTNPVTTYNHDICLNLSWDGEKDGTYEPYVKYSYPLDDSLTLRGIPTLDANNRLRYDGDTYESDGTVTRLYDYIEFDGSEDETWTLSFENTRNGFTGVLPIATNAYTRMLTNRIDVSTSSSTSGADNDRITCRGVHYNNSASKNFYIYAPSSTIADVTALRAWLAANPVQVVYWVPEASQTTESADPYQNPQVVDDWGTEEYVDASVAAGTRDVAIPVGHDTFYQANLRAKVEMSPDSPSGDGDYIVRQEGGQNVYVPLVIPDELPDAPSTDGTYTLTVTVTDGTPTLSWVANT